MTSTFFFIGILLDKIPDKQGKAQHQEEAEYPQQPISVSF